MKGVIFLTIIDTIALILLIVGGLNWGSIGIFGFNFVHALFGAGSILTNIVFILVGISALWCITLLFRNRDE